MADIVLETPRLHLRRWRPGDLDLWLAHLNTPQVRACLGGVQSAEKVAETLARAAREWDEQGFSFLAVELREDASFLGTCGISRIDTACAPEALRGAVQIGWQLRADCWGHGYATEAAGAVLALAFERFDLPIVYAQTSERNGPSWRVMQRLGMERLDQLDYDDPDYPAEENPTMVWGLGRDRWPPARVAA
jgi:RimJ/RimL family protein N-acetyltransferase